MKDNGMSGKRSTDAVQIISIREHPKYFDRAAGYLSSKWGIDRKVYEESISDGIKRQIHCPAGILC